MRIPSRPQLFLMTIMVWFAAGCLGVLLMWWAPWRTWHGTLTQENFQRIQMGMTKDEVKAIIGDDPEGMANDFCAWHNGSRIEVFFDHETGRVIDKGYFPPLPWP
jgi:hypothetical protein